MKILITGHRGLIGSHLFDYLTKENIKFGLKNIVKGIDVREGKDINQILYNHVEQFDLVIHCAALCRIRECIKYPMLTHYNNARGTLTVFEFARKNKIPKVIIFSSSRVLYKERNIYTATKIYGEEIAKGYADAYGIKYKIIRPSTVYGEMDSLDRIIPKFIVSALTKQPLKIYGDNNKTLDITYIQDFLNAFRLILNDPKWNQCYDVGENQEVMVKDIAEFIIKETRSKSKIEYCNAETAQPQNVRIDNSKIRNLGYKSICSWKTGIKNTIKYIKKQKCFS